MPSSYFTFLNFEKNNRIHIFITIQYLKAASWQQIAQHKSSSFRTLCVVYEYSRTPVYGHLTKPVTPPSVARERFFNSVVKRGVWPNLFKLGCGGHCKPPPPMQWGPGQSPGGKHILGNNRLEINWKSGLWVAVYTPNSDPISDVHWLVGPTALR